MRKLKVVFAVVVFTLISTTTFAQETPEVMEPGMEPGMEVLAPPTDAEIAAAVAQERTEVKVSELPEVVTKTLISEFSDYTAEKAYKAIENGNEVYYVSLVKEGEAIIAVIDANGNIVDNK